MNHDSLGCEQPSGLDVSQSLNVQDAIPGLISCAGVTGSVGITCHAHATQMASLSIMCSVHWVTSFITSRLVCVFRAKGVVVIHVRISAFFLSRKHHSSFHYIQVSFRRRQRGVSNVQQMTKKYEKKERDKTSDG